MVQQLTNTRRGANLVLKLFLLILFCVTGCLASDSSNEVIVESSKEEDTKYVSIAIICVLLVMTLNNYLESQLKILKEKYSWVKRYVQNAGMSTFLGILVGLLLKLFGATKLSHTIKNGFEQLFMIVLLPPILFEGALNMKRKPFFKNMGSILLFAFVGTLIAVFISAVLMWFLGAVGYGKEYSFYHCFIFGSVISATDPVSVLGAFKDIEPHSKLYSLIFGESMLNDAVSLTLYRALLDLKFKPNLSVMSIVSKFLFLVITSAIIGLLFGLFASMILKKSDWRSKSHMSQSLSVMLIIPWVCYLFSEIMSLSGIVSIMFCGVSTGHYAMDNISFQARENIQEIYHAVASNFESLAFIFIGVAVFGFQHNLQAIGFDTIILNFVVLLFARWCNVHGISYLLSFWRSTQVTQTFQFVMWFSGFRGAMAFAMAIQSSFFFPEGDVGSDLLTLTVIYSCATIFGFGTLLETVIEKCDVTNRNEKEREFDKRLPGDLLKQKFVQLDERLFRKWVVRAKNADAGMEMIEQKAKIGAENPEDFGIIKFGGTTVDQSPRNPLEMNIELSSFKGIESDRENGETQAPMDRKDKSRRMKGDQIPIYAHSREASASGSISTRLRDEPLNPNLIPEREEENSDKESPERALSS